MLTIKHAFAKLMTLLNQINPKVPLPFGFEPFLWNCMEEMSPKANEQLVVQGEIPKYAYYIIRGYIYVYYFDEDGGKHAKRFYKEDRIVAFLSFLEQHASPYYIVAGRDTLLSRISNADMQHIYKTWPGMKEFAMLVVLQYDEYKEKIKMKLLSKDSESKVRDFYNEYACLRNAKAVRLDEVIALYLNICIRALRGFR